MFPKIPDVSNIPEFCEPLSHISQHAITPVQKNASPQSMKDHLAFQFTVRSLRHAVHTDSLSLIDMYAGVLEKNRSPWFCRNPSTSHLHKTAPIKRHTDSKSQLQKTRRIKQNTHKLVWVSRFVRFVCFVSVDKSTRLHLIILQHVGTDYQSTLSSATGIQTKKGEPSPTCHSWHGSSGT